MNLTAAYHGLALLLRYPQSKAEMLLALQEVESVFQELGVESPCASFAGVLKESTLHELQEEYVAVFDFNPATAPYLGHHLYGDHQKKGGYLIRLKQEFGRHGFEPEQGELFDHLGLIIGFLAHLSRKGEERYRREFINDLVLPGVRRLIAGRPKNPSPWTTLANAAGLILSVDSKEGSLC